MTINPFLERETRPDDAALTRALGKARPHWDALVAHLDEVGATHEWKHYGAKHGWQLKATKQKAAVLYLIPHERSFLAALALKGKAIERALASELPGDLLHAIETARDYAEGRPARVEVKTKVDVAVVVRLLAIKLGL
jgi:hypothetical protein